VQGACSTLTDPAVPTIPSAPTGDTPTDTPTTDPTTGEDGTDPAADETETPAPAKKKKTLTPQPSAGCNVSSSGSADIGPLAGLLAVVMGLALGRRKRR
jgi:MYXO-CTERM domain-containing protein